MWRVLLEYNTSSICLNPSKAFDSPNNVASNLCTNRSHVISPSNKLHESITLLLVICYQKATHIKLKAVYYMCSTLKLVSVVMDNRLMNSQNTVLKGQHNLSNLNVSIIQTSVIDHGYIVVKHISNSRSRVPGKQSFSVNIVLKQTKSDTEQTNKGNNRSVWILF